MADELLVRVIMESDYRKTEDGWEVFIKARVKEGSPISERSLHCDTEEEAKKIVKDLKNMLDSLNKHN